MPPAKKNSKEIWPSPILYPDFLPISQRREEIADAIRQHQVIIVAGETGSGKTTQLPKICLSLGYGQNGLIGHTQPRRIAARTVADRIACELKTPLGDGVGYQVRFNDVSNENTRIKLMTDGVLLAEFQRDRLLKRYDVIIIDEAHERSLNIDFLLGLLKPLCSKRPELKIIITSATIDLEKFSEHFTINKKRAPIIEVSGRTYPVETIYQPPAQGAPPLAELITETVEQIISNEAKGQYKTSGDILVFCAGEREIREAAQTLRRRQLPLEVLPLYSRLSINEQNKVFKTSTRRKVVLATNVAETSITVPGIAYVIDPGLARISRYSFRSKVQRLPIEAISQASANQRLGRCGRIANGVCIRLYSLENFEQRAAFTPAEILRSNLASVILKMRRLNISDIDRFNFIDRPDKRLLNDGYKLLQELNAIDQQQKLTKIGRQMSDLPVDPRYARILVSAQKLGCLRDALIVISGLSIQDPRERPADKQAAADQQHKAQQHTHSDFFSYLYLWQAIGDARQTLSNTKFKQHCIDNFWSIARVFEWRELYRQLATLCKQHGWKIETWSTLTLPKPQQNKAKQHKTVFDTRYERLHRALLSGLLSNIANKDVDGGYLATRSRHINLYPTSSLSKRKPKWLVAAELLETSRLFVHTAAEVKPEWVADAAQHLCRYNYSDPHYHVRSGTVRAYRKTLLYGLTLRAKERVNYAPIKPQESRIIFIQQALVEQQYQPRDNRSKGHFATHNKHLTAQIEKLETKTRRRNLLVNEQVLFEFYDSRLPARINNRTSLEQWIKDGNNDALKLDRAQLMADSASAPELAQFPDHLEVQGKTIKIHYKFSPGEAHDGVTMLVPISVLAPFPDHIGDWLVPGLLREKCIALIKTLPKTLRRQFAPAADTIDRVLPKLTACNTPLHQALADQIFHTRGIKVAASDFDMGKLDQFYLTNYRIIDTDQSLVNEGRDLAALKRDYADSVQQSVHSSNAYQRTQLERHNIRAWDFGDLSSEIEYQHQGMTVRAYPMLKLEADTSISLLIHDQQKLALYHTQNAIVALAKLVLSNGKQAQSYKYLCKQLLNFTSSEKTSKSGLSALATQLKSIAPSHPNKQLWQAELINCALRLCCFENGVASIRTSQQFETAIEGGAKNWVSMALDLESAFIAAHDKKNQLLTAVNHFSANTLNEDLSLEDIKAQLYRLFEPNFLRYTSLTELQQYPRYLKAVESRLDKLKFASKTVSQEAALLGMQTQFNQRALELQIDEHGLDSAYATEPKLKLFATMLEEWRVSIFAQHLATQLRVSEKRLEKVWLEIINAN